MNAPDFHALRLTGIGGSDCAAALGLSPWKSPLQLYLEKVGDAPPVVESEPMRFGTLLEPIVLAEYQRRVGMPVLAAEPARHDVYRFMLAHYDGIRQDGRIVEAKTARSDQGWGDEGTDDVPQAYLLQVTHYMIVSESDIADLAVLFGGNELRIYTLHRKPELAALVIEGERQFWQSVEQREPPSPQTLAEINLRWRESQARTIELAPNVAEACRRLAATRDTIAEAEGEAEKCEAQIKFAMADADTGTIDGVPAVTWKQAKPTRHFDLKGFRAASPDLAAEYDVERPGSRRFLLKIQGATA
jgi:putative phage-type endonuclease